MGPMARKGKKVSITRIKILTIKTMGKIISSVLREISELLLLSWILPAIASITNIGMNLPAHITIAVETLKNTVLAVVPRKSDPLFAAAEVNS